MFVCIVSEVCISVCLLSSDKASKTMVELLSTYTEENASQAREDAHKYGHTLCYTSSVG